MISRRLTQLYKPRTQISFRYGKRSECCHGTKRNETRSFIKICSLHLWMYNWGPCVEIRDYECSHYIFTMKICNCSKSFQVNVHEWGFKWKHCFHVLFTCVVAIYQMFVGWMTNTIAHRASSPLLAFRAILCNVCSGLLAVIAFFCYQTYRNKIAIATIICMLICSKCHAFAIFAIRKRFCLGAIFGDVTRKLHAIIAPTMEISRHGYWCWLKKRFDSKRHGKMIISDYFLFYFWSNSIAVDTGW